MLDFLRLQIFFLMNLEWEAVLFDPEGNATI